MWWNSGTVWGNGGTVIVDSVVEQWNSYGGTVLVEQGWWNSETVIEISVNGDGETVWWNSGTVTVEQCGRTLEQ